MDDAHNPVGVSRNFITVLHYWFKNELLSAEIDILQNNGFPVLAF